MTRQEMLDRLRDLAVEKRSDLMARMDLNATRYGAADHLNQPATIADVMVLTQAILEAVADVMVEAGLVEP